ncbi:VAMP3 protein, partial [Atractosteus spatula]|nr:VAMP3 protein [Atractosteus spatula]
MSSCLVVGPADVDAQQSLCAHAAPRVCPQVVDIMRVNVDKVLERDQKLSELDDRADALQAGASQFETSAAKLKRKYWWKNCKGSGLGHLSWLSSPARPLPLRGQPLKTHPGAGRYKLLAVGKEASVGGEIRATGNSQQWTVCETCTPVRLGPSPPSLNRVPGGRKPAAYADEERGLLCHKYACVPAVSLLKSSRPGSFPAGRQAGSCPHGESGGLRGERRWCSQCGENTPGPSQRPGAASWSLGVCGLWNWVRSAHAVRSQHGLSRGTSGVPDLDGNRAVWCGLSLGWLGFLSKKRGAWLLGGVEMPRSSLSHEAEEKEGALSSESRGVTGGDEEGEAGGAQGVGVGGGGGGGGRSRSSSSSSSEKSPGRFPHGEPAQEDMEMNSRSAADPASAGTACTDSVKRYQRPPVVMAPAPVAARQPGHTTQHNSSLIHLGQRPLEVYCRFYCMHGCGNKALLLKVTPTEMSQSCWCAGAFIFVSQKRIKLLFARGYTYMRTLGSGNSTTVSVADIYMPL